MKKQLGSKAIVMALSLIAITFFLLVSRTNADPLRVIVFPGGFNWPIWAAMEQGYFAEEGVEVELTPTKGSAFQMQALIEGRFDIAMTAMDNVIAYQEGQGAVKPDKPVNLAAIMGADNGFLSLISACEIDSIAGLKGQKVAVDAMTTGYAFVLFEMLAREGLWPDGVEVQSFGGVSNRFKTLLAGEHQGTLMITPFDIMSVNRGYNQIATALDTVGAYQGVVAAVQRDWAVEHRRQLVAYIRGYLKGVNWLYHAQNRGKAVQVLLKNVPQMDESLASKSYEILLHPETGFFKNAAIDRSGVEEVLRLRRTYGSQKARLQRVDAYIDTSFHQEAISK